MAVTSTTLTDMLPQFLLPHLSWQNAFTAPQRLVAAAARPVSGIARRSFNPAWPNQNTACAAPSPTPSSNFRTTAMRQRAHHFDTLKFVERLQREGFTEKQSDAMMRIVNDVIEESIQKLTRTIVHRQDSANVIYKQRVNFAKLRSELLSVDRAESNPSGTTQERLTNDINKLSSRLTDQTSRTKAGIRQDLNLERGRIHGEAAKQELKIKETESKIEQEVGTLRQKLEQVKFQTLQWLISVCTGFSALLLAAWRLFM